MQFIDDLGLTCTWGLLFVSTWLSFQCRFLRYGICIIDCTVFPANAAYLANAQKTFVTLASMGKNMMGLVLYPVFQSQTSAMTLIKHRHGLENSLLKAGMSVIHPVQILYSKPESTASDRRSMSQLGLATFHTNYSEHSFYQSNVVKEGKVGPCPLMRVSDFRGFDMDLQKPGASARVEQCLGFDNGMIGDDC